jgi:hypothetical protein
VRNSYDNDSEGLSQRCNFTSTDYLKELRLVSSPH